MGTTTPRIVHGVPGPTGEPGVLLLVPRNEVLDWDLKAEVASTARYWMADREAWWVAAPYAATAEAILTRVFDRPPKSVEAAPPDAVAAASPNGRGAAASNRLPAALSRLWMVVQRIVSRDGAGRA